MTTDRWARISRIYHDVLARPLSARDALIREACDGDQGLENEVRSLLAQPSGDSFLHGVMHGDIAATRLSLSVPGPLGRFELRRLLGVGGMGEVYQAHDPELGRDVALKIVPAAFTNDAERLARFEREARVLAALSHPHIAAIYGVEAIESAGTAVRALVLELVDGTTLAGRLGNGPLSTDDAFAIARQIATAVEAAHDKGIIHRDLKPANIKIRSDGVVKVLDFGLAKAEGFDSETSAGVILGTPAYMSPEQARGLPVDQRTDVWSFGCVLYEMLCGRPAFSGDTPSDILAAVLQREPDWQALPAETPPAVRRLLRRCLERTTQRRLKDLGDARLDLEPDQHDAGLEPAHRTGRRAAWVAAAVSIAALGAAVWFWPTSSPRSIQFTLTPTEGVVIVSVPVPSPDGRQLVYVGRSLSGETSLWTRPLDSSTPRRLEGTDNAERPFWSPDGNFVGFSAAGSLKRAPVAGGPIQRVTDLDPLTLGSTWNSENLIVFTPSNKAPLHRVAAAGGAHEPLTSLSVERRENSHRWPQFLPDGRHLLYTARSDLPEQTAIYVTSLEAPAAPKRLAAAQSPAIYVSSGHLLFVRDNTLLMQRFDSRQLELLGDPVAIAGGVVADPSAASADFAASADGIVVTYNTIRTSRLAWFDRTGAEVGTVPVRGNFSQVRLAPDASRAVVVMPDPQNGNRDVWVVVLATGALTRITSHAAADWFPVWSPDGTEIVFMSDRRDTPTFYRVPVSGAGGERLVFTAAAANGIFPTDWSPDGNTLLMHSYPRGNIFMLPLAPAGSPQTLIDSPFTDWVATFSPDGRSIAYVSDESGEEEVYVSPIATRERYRVSIGGGVQPRWRRDGRELFFVGAGGRLASVAIDPVGPFKAERATPLFETCLSARGYGVFSYRYDVTADAERSLWICEDDRQHSAVVMVDGLRTFTGR